MIKILGGLPDNVIAASAVGRGTRQDYEALLIPALRRLPRSIRRFGVIARSARTSAAFEIYALSQSKLAADFSFLIQMGMPLQVHKSERDRTESPRIEQCGEKPADR
jgi:hypothetical protein